MYIFPLYSFSEDNNRLKILKNRFSGGRNPGGKYFSRWRQAASFCQKFLDFRVEMVLLSLNIMDVLIKVGKKCPLYLFAPRLVFLPMG